MPCVLCVCALAFGVDVRADSPNIERKVGQIGLLAERVEKQINSVLCYFTSADCINIDTIFYMNSYTFLCEYFRKKKKNKGARAKL